jgi:hypothetical protein
LIHKIISDQKATSVDPDQMVWMWQLICIFSDRTRDKTRVYVVKGIKELNIFTCRSGSMFSLLMFATTRSHVFNSYTVLLKHDDTWKHDMHLCHYV